jgi:mRNA-degrading endonuclease toxin of MazEF toxin-antitoxin module
VVAAAGSPARGDVVDYTLGSRRVRVLVVSANAYSRAYPVIVLIHDRADGDVPGILVPLPSDLAGGGTIDLSRIRFADPAAFGHRHGRITPAVAAKVDQGLRRLLGLQ